MKQLLLTVSAGKRLIAKALAAHPAIKSALQSNTLVIIAGTTNGYVAEEILGAISENGFTRRRFFRGITLPPRYKVTETGRLADESGFPGDVVIEKGVWQRGKTIYDVVNNLKAGDVIIKGANAIDLEHRRAAILIGNPQGGTIILALQATLGRRARLIIPVGLEKRVAGSLDDLAARLNTPGEKGLRLLPVPGEVFTEIDALATLTGVKAELFASGGVGGAEGCCWLLVNGTPEQEALAEKIVREIADESPFEI
ncbi:MAG: hypothetical protein C4555_01820 [Dehalococcoidia bacterium]|nr:MAG: hypothetical protein C4555_01820 [Dehalococcoidia bacterium]